MRRWMSGLAGTGRRWAFFVAASMVFVPGGGASPRRHEVTVSNLVGLACIDKLWPIDGDGCLFALGAIGSGFFRGMRRVETNGGPIFLKGSQRVEYFPEEVSLLVIVTPMRCGKGGKGYAEWLPHPVDLLRSVHAQADYIETLHPHPLEVALAEQGEAEELLGFDGNWQWQHKFVIQTKGVLWKTPWRCDSFRLMAGRCSTALCASLVPASGGQRNHPGRVFLGNWPTPTVAEANLDPTVFRQYANAQGRWLSPDPLQGDNH